MTPNPSPARRSLRVTTVLERLETWVTRRSTVILVALTVLEVSAGVAYCLILGDRVRYPDEQLYLDYAANLARGHGFTLDGIHLTAFHPPGYPLLLGFLASLGASLFVMRLLNFVLLGLTIPCGYSLLRGSHGPRAGLFAGLLILAYPVLFYTAGTFYPQTVATALLLGGLALHGTQHPSPWTSMGAGVLLGWGVLTVPTLAFILPLLLVFDVHAWRIAWRRSLLVLVCSAITIGFWTVRNYAVFDRFVPVSTNFGINFLIGNSPATTPNNGPNADVSAYTSAAERLGLDEFDRNSYYLSQAVAYLRSDPGHAVDLYVRKVLNYFNYRNELRTSSESSPLRDALMLATYGPLLGLALARLALMGRMRMSPLEGFLAMTYLLGALVSAVVFTRIRYRLPFDVLLILLVAAFLDRLWGTVISRRGGSSGAGLAGSPSSEVARG